MKSLAAVVALLLVTVGAANAEKIVITPKASDSGLVLTMRGGKVGVVAKPELLKDTGAANAGRICNQSEGLRPRRGLDDKRRQGR